MHHSDIRVINIDIEGFNRGDTRVFQKIFDLFFHPLVYFVDQLIQNKPEAEDIVLQIMTKLWDRHEHFNSLINIRAFLYIVARNTCLNYLKSSQRQQNAKNDLLYRQIDEQEDFVQSKLIKAETLEAIRREIEMLPSKRRAVFKMFYFENLSVQEIAGKMRITPGTVRVCKSQALVQLRNNLFKKKLLAVALCLFLMQMQETT